MDRLEAAKLITMQTLKDRLVSRWDLLADKRGKYGRCSDLLMNMARIKTILRERYNYTVNY